jgi:hypothetical protein
VRGVFKVLRAAREALVSASVRRRAALRRGDNRESLALIRPGERVFCRLATLNRRFGEKIFNSVATKAKIVRPHPGTISSPRADGSGRRSRENFAHCRNACAAGISAIRLTAASARCRCAPIARRRHASERRNARGIRKCPRSSSIIR